DESLDQFDGVFALEARTGERADPVQVAGEPRLLLVEVIELRVAPRNRRRIVPDLRGERAPAVFEVELDFVPHRRELGGVPRGFQIPYHTETCSPGRPASSTVGISGAAARRVFAVIA